MMLRLRFDVLALGFFSALAAACSGTPDELSAVEAEAEDEASLEAASPLGALDVRFDGLEPLGPSHVYEGWLIVQGEAISAKRFNLSSPGEVVTFGAPRRTLRAATAYVLTIEPAVGDDPKPSKAHVLAGDFRGHGSRKRADLGIAHRSAFGQDFGTAAGRFILETPSSAETDDWRQGVWFVNPATGMPSLSLPTLPEGWIYEGWIAGPSGPISTGRFKSAQGADSDRAGVTAGPLPTPPFPGQDFIAPPIDLVGATVVISVEPEDDDSPAPFAIKPLVSSKVTAAGPGVLQDLANVARAHTPSGVASVR